MLTDFRQFLLRGNVVDLAVGVVIGAAFGAVITALVNDLITPVLGALGGDGQFSSGSFTINGSRFAYGHFINAVISFLLIAAAVFFFVVRPMNKLMNVFKTEADVTARTNACPECLSQIPVRARRCAFCTASVAPTA